MLGTLDYFLTLGVLGYGMVKSSAVAFALLVHAVFLGFSVTVAAVLLPRKNTWIMLRSFTKSNSSDDDMNPNNEFLNERTDA